MPGIEPRMNGGRGFPLPRTGEYSIAFFRRRAIDRYYFPVPKPIRLRHILQLGALLEQVGEDFYRRCAGCATDPAIRDLFLKLADDENDHYRLIDSQLSRWHPLRASRRKLRTLDTQGLLTGLFSSPPEPDADLEQIVEFSLEVERKMIAFYEEHTPKFLEIWKVAKLRGMVEEEKEHIRDLEAILD